MSRRKPDHVDEPADVDAPDTKEASSAGAGPADAQGRPRLEAVHFGGPHFGRMARVLEHTARRHLVGWDVLVREVEASADAPDVAHLVGKLEHSHVRAHTQKVAAWCRIVQAAEDGDRLLLVDADTFLRADLSPAWAEDFDLAYTTGRELFPLSTGVVFLRVSPGVRDFVATWWEKHLELLEGPRADLATALVNYGAVDQAAFALAHVDHVVGGALVDHEFACSEWNCEGGCWSRPDGDAGARLVHITGTLRRCIFRQSPMDPALAPIAQEWGLLERDAGRPSA